MRRVPVLLAAGLLLAAGCGKPAQVTTNRLHDARRPAVLTYVPPEGARRVEVRAHGQIDGTATLWATNFAPVKLTGRFDARVAVAWGAGRYVVHYAPVNVRTGDVTLEVVFRR